MFNECEENPSFPHSHGGNTLPNKGRNDPPNPLSQANPRYIPMIATFALLVLALVVAFSRKARAEILNKYMLFPLGAFVLMVISLIIMDWALDYLQWVSDSVLWILLTGTIVLVLGFQIGRWWEKQKNQGI